jgi:pyruvate dehydrogenase E1 component alpha subunit
MKNIGKEKALQMLEQMIRVRRFEEGCLKSYQQKFITGFCHTYIGQEAVAVGAMAHLTPTDAYVTSYRCHAQGLIGGLTSREVMAEMFGKITGCVRGKGGSMHVFSKKNNYLGGHGIVGGQIPIGLGAAFALKYEEKEGVALTFFGDGASMQGTFHESLNLASLWDVPVIFICENNQYGMGTSNDRALANPQVSDFAAAYKMKGYEVDGMNLEASYNSFGEIIADCKKNSRPALVNVTTYRYQGHSVSDAGLYRTKDEVKCWKEKDPINSFYKSMEEQGWIDEAGYKALDKEMKAEVKDALDFAKESPWPPMDELTNHVYA